MTTFAHHCLLSCVYLENVVTNAVSPFGCRPSYLEATMWGTLLPRDHSILFAYLEIVTTNAVEFFGCRTWVSLQDPRQRHNIASFIVLKKKKSRLSSLSRCRTPMRGSSYYGLGDPRKRHNTASFIFVRHNFENVGAYKYESSAHQDESYCASFKGLVKRNKRDPWKRHNQGTLERGPILPLSFFLHPTFKLSGLTRTNQAHIWKSFVVPFSRVL